MIITIDGKRFDEIMNLIREVNLSRIRSGWWPVHVWFEYPPPTVVLPVDFRFGGGPAAEKLMELGHIEAPSSDANFACGFAIRL